MAIKEHVLQNYEFRIKELFRQVNELRKDVEKVYDMLNDVREELGEELDELRDRIEKLEGEK